MQVSWGEYDAIGNEISFKELISYATPHWDLLEDRILQIQSSGVLIAISCVFIRLDTEIATKEGGIWADDSAEVQISVTPPELSPETVGVNYTTYIDAWLGVTYGEHHTPRINHELASLNQPRLERFLISLATLLGASFTVGHSQLYPSAISDKGFTRPTGLPR
jgi:hypothetical protein